MRWHTPLRLQHQGKPVFKPTQLDATILVRALLRRQMQWQQITHQNPAELATASQDLLASADSCTLDTRNLQWLDIERRSGTQGQKLPLGGLIGIATLQGPAAHLQALLPLLQLGEQVHIGKETVMGLGRYQLSPLQPG
jgi:CRISPR/Cas system endoribonuclease Cas6 (RAMP superfamily)